MINGGNTNEPTNMTGGGQHILRFVAISGSGIIFTEERLLQRFWRKRLMGRDAKIFVMPSGNGWEFKPC